MVRKPLIENPSGVQQVLKQDPYRMSFGGPESVRPKKSNLKLRGRSNSQAIHRLVATWGGSIFLG